MHFLYKNILRFADLIIVNSKEFQMTMKKNFDINYFNDFGIEPISFEINNLDYLK